MAAECWVVRSRAAQSRRRPGVTSVVGGMPFSKASSPPDNGYRFADFYSPDGDDDDTFAAFQQYY